MTYADFRRTIAEIRQTGQVDGDKYDVTDGVRGYRQKALPDLMPNPTDPVIVTEESNTPVPESMPNIPWAFETILEHPEHIMKGCYLCLQQLVCIIL